MTGAAADSGTSPGPECPVVGAGRSAPTGVGAAAGRTAGAGQKVTPTARMAGTGSTAVP